MTRGLGSASAALIAVLLLSCSCSESSRPGFPRSELEPLDSAPFPFAAPADAGLSERDIWLFRERLYSRVVAKHLVGAEILVIKDGRIV
ncbi:MAG: hypothetical protein ACWGON_10290, partial [Gemmatimonadota bacterium]